MTLSIGFILIWLVGIIFYFMPKKLSFLGNLFIFMILFIITRNYMTLLDLNLQYIKTTKDPVDHLFYLLQREVTMPITVLIFLNVFYQITGKAKKALAFIITLITLNLYNLLILNFDVVQYVKWHMAYDVFYDMVTLFISLALGNLLLRVKGAT